MKFGAMDPFKMLRPNAFSGALQKSPVRTAPAAPVAPTNGPSLPRLNNGPATDVFTPTKASTPEPRFSGGKIVPPIGNAANPAKPSLAETLFGRHTRAGEHPFNQLNMIKKPVPSGLLSFALPVLGVGALASVITGPAMVLANPSLMPKLLTALPLKII